MTTVLVLSLLFFFRIQIATGFARMFGDRLDGFIQLSIIQHWANVFAGREAWNTAAYFHPWPGTLGYNDGYFLFGLIYAPVRASGLDPFMAEFAALVVMRAAGFVGFVLFAQEAGRLRTVFAVPGAALFTIGSNLYVQSGHGQLFAASLTPLFLWLAWRAGAALAARRDRAAIAWGAGAAGLFGAWLLTGFYTAWFTALLAALTLLLAAPFVRLRPFLRWPTAAIGLAFALAALPFAAIYGPTAAETGMHPFDEIWADSPSPLDFLHVGKENLLFGPLDQWVGTHLAPDRPEFSERSIGFGPIMLCLAVLGLAAAWQERRAAPMRCALAVAAVLATALVVHVGHVTLWSIVWELVPGARAIRTVSRFAFVLATPFTLMAVLGLERVRRPRVAAALALLLVVEEFTWRDPTALDRPAELSWLRSIPPAPPGCRVFYTEGIAPEHATSTPIDDVYPHNTDAMLLAELRALPTINGFSTFTPPGWALKAPRTPGYAHTVRDYLADHGLTDGSCGLDLAERNWRMGPP